jgi:hypothetical protein
MNQDVPIVTNIRQGTKDYSSFLQLASLNFFPGLLREVGHRKFTLHPNNIRRESVSAAGQNWLFTYIYLRQERPVGG